MYLALLRPCRSDTAFKSVSFVGSVISLNRVFIVKAICFGEEVKEGHYIVF